MTEQLPKTTPPDILWTAVLDQNIIHPLLAVGETLVAATQPSGPTPEHGSVQALSLTDGAPRWRHDFEYALVSGMHAYCLHAEQKEIVVVAAGSSDFLKGEGALLALDESGAVFWRWQGEAQYYAAPVVANRQVIVVAGGKTLLVISPEQDGDEAKRVALPVTASLFAPLVHENVAYIPCRGPELLAVELEGDVRWHFQYQGGRRDWLDKTPVISGSHIFAASSQGTVYALDRASGNLDWKTAVGENRPLGQPAAMGERLFVGHQSGLDVLDARNGRTLWAFSTERPVSAAPLILGDTVYATDENHILHALDLETGVERWRHKLERRIETPPILAPDALLVADRGGNVVAWERPTLPEPATDPAADPDAIAAEKRQAATDFVEQNQPLKAAEIWHELGNLEQAAALYEAGAAWLEAANLWQQLDRYGKRAQALAKHALAVSKQEVDDEQKAAAWEQAARAFAETGQKERRRRSEKEVARYRQQAILTIEVEPESDLIRDAWARLNFIVRNDGFGVARRLHVALKDDRFEGQTARTQSVVTLQPGRDYSHWLDVVPRAHGSDVPMQLVIEYADKTDRIHTLERTFYMMVKPETGMLSIQSRIEPSTSTHELANLPTVDGRDLYDFREKLTKYFSKDELVDILFEMDLREGDFSEKLSAMARELIIGLAENGRLLELITICQEHRPKVEW